jgi:pyruvate/2-oxoglutarate dehydrogenase complex dihydrolipoamide dehydrogenase (E3) component
MIGAEPHTTPLHACGVELDDHGFVVTHDGFATSVPGLFAVGDVRSGSVKRVASAVGEGSVVVSAVHAHLAETAAVQQTPDAGLSCPGTFVRGPGERRPDRAARTRRTP